MSDERQHDNDARSPAAFAFVLAVGAFFWVSLTAALAVEPLPSLSALAPFLALAIAGEELAVQLARSRGIVLSFSGPAHVAAAIVLGPMPAALVAALAVVVVDVPRKESRRHALVNSSMFGGSIWAAGTVFQLLGGSSHSLTIAALPALAVLVGTRYAATSLVFALGTSVAIGRSFRLALKEIVVAEASSAVGEGSLGILVAFGITTESWIIFPLLIPLLAALYSSKATFQRLRAETGDALDAVAQVVDERDATTAEHTRRVADYVQRFANEIELPERETERLVQAARYHDLGKIAVDVSTLAKDGRLTKAEMHTIYRHPRLAARLLAPFHFAQEMAAFVELHHERYDGRGYYAVPSQEVPIEAHVLIVADSFDAMTSARPYRPALTLAEAAQELRDKAGTQFHPLVATAFAAMVLGETAAAALGPSDLSALRAAFSRVRLLSPIPLRTLLAPRSATLSLLVVTLALAGLSAPTFLEWTAAAATASTGAWWGVLAYRAGRARERALAVLSSGGEPADALAAAALPGWAAWLRLDADTGAFTPVRASGDADPRDLDEACAWAVRREGATEARLSGGTYLLLAEASSKGRLALGLARPPAVAARNLVAQLVDALGASLADGSGAARLRAVADVDRREEDGDRRAVMLVDLRIFDDVRRAAGQLLAEKVIEAAELELRRVLRSADEIVRLDDDRFAAFLCVPSREALETISRRVESDLRRVKTPRNTAQLDASVTAAYVDQIEHAPELAEIAGRFALTAAGAR
jgi:GGDEF domain-containing protein